jgi:putative aminopeptidase FrvX
MSSTPPDTQTLHEHWLLQLTAIPTAAGRERRVVEWIHEWAAQRPDLALAADRFGNLTIEHTEAAAARERPFYITAHLDHPAFVVESIDTHTLYLSFRGGVLDPYFAHRPPIVLFTNDDRPVRAVVTGSAKESKPFRTAVAELASGESDEGLAPGDVGRWDFPEPEIRQETAKPGMHAGRVLYTHACDDLAAVAAALAAMDALRDETSARHVRLLFTRAEEIGFIGAIAACREKLLPRDGRYVLLENSRSFPESPIGGGPIVRVGDRMSTFSPALTAGIAKVAEELAKSDGERKDTDPGQIEAAKRHGSAFKWQRKLMPGGACESTTYMAYGYESTCLCLPLGNYHNMADLQAVQDEDADAIANARPGREHISLDDYHNLVRLLVGCGTQLSEVEPPIDTMEKLYAERSFVLSRPTTPGPDEVPALKED